MQNKSKAMASTTMVGKTSQKNQTAGVILAAGMSERFGRPKQLLKLNHKYMLQWVLEAALASRLAKVVLVLGYEHQKILQVLEAVAEHPRLQIVINHAYSEGQSRSVKTGLEAVRETFSSVMFLLGDQPLLESARINHLLDRYRHTTKDICVPVYRGRRGNPAIFGINMYAKLMQIEGDRGGQEIILQNPDRVLYVEVDDATIFLDIDTEADFENLKSITTNQRLACTNGHSNKSANCSTAYPTDFKTIVSTSDDHHQS